MTKKLQVSSHLLINLVCSVSCDSASAVFQVFLLFLELFVLLLKLLKVPVMALQYTLEDPKLLTSELSILKSLEKLASILSLLVL